MLSKTTFPLLSVEKLINSLLGVIFILQAFGQDSSGITHTPSSADMGPYGATGSLQWFPAVTV